MSWGVFEVVEIPMEHC